MDKKIIIDSVDVSKCRYLFDDTSYKRSKTSCSITLKDCKYLGNNCYYKQLKRKEQECERLKSDLTDLSKIIDCKNGTIFTFKEQLDQLKAENEELKEQLTILDDEDVVVEITVKQFKEYKKLKTTLQEIKEIAKYELNNLTESAVNGGRYVEILQKISECEAKNDMENN